MEEEKKLLINELQKFEDSSETYKPYMDLMDDISAWLKGLQK